MLFTYDENEIQEIRGLVDLIGIDNSRISDVVNGNIEIEIGRAFTEEEINNGAIDTLSVFTDIYLNTKTGSTAKVLATANFSGYKVDGTNIIRLSDPRLGYLRSSNLEVTLNNGSSVTTYGNATPRYIEKSKVKCYTKI